MAFQQNYTDIYGVNYPASYWHCDVILYKSTQSGEIRFMGFSDITQKGNRQIGNKTYYLNSVWYNTYFVPTLLEPAGVDPYKQAYLMASAVNDTNLGTKDGEGNPVLESFFKNATNV